MEEIESGQTACQDLPRITVMPLEDGETYCSLNNRRLYVLKWAREKGLLAGNKIGVRVKQQSAGTSKVASKYSLERCSNTAKFMAGPRNQDVSEGEARGGVENAGGDGAADEEGGRQQQEETEDKEEAEEEEEETVGTTQKRGGGGGKQRKDRRGNHSEFLWGSSTAASDGASAQGNRPAGKETAAADSDGSKGDPGDASLLDHKTPAVRSGADGVRNKYAAHGSSTAYYEEEGGTYTNPHDGAIKVLLHQLVATAPEMWSGKVLDLACGSGEATEALVNAGLPYKMIDACDPFTLDAYYARCRPFFLSEDTATYVDAAAAAAPASAASETVNEGNASDGATATEGTVDIAASGSAPTADAGGMTISGDAGGGAASAGLQVDMGTGRGVAEEIIQDHDGGIATECAANDGDSTTIPADVGIISAATKESLSDQVFTWSFEDIAAGALIDRHYSVVVCSFALHLCEPSYLATTCSALAMVADRLIVLTPHKRPDIKPAWGWALVSDERDDHWRVRCRQYKSLFSSIVD